MHTAIKRILFVLLLSAGTIYATAADLNIAFVDMNGVFNNYHRTLAMQASLQEQESFYQHRVKELEEEVSIIEREREQMRETAINLALNAEVRANSREEAKRLDTLLQEKNHALRQYTTRQKEKLVDEYLGTRGQLIDELRRFLADYAERNGHDLVLDTSGLTRNFIPVVLYYPAQKDITAQVLEELNAGHEDIDENAGTNRVPMNLEDLVQ